MTQSTTPQTPGVPAPMSSVWPPSGAMIPFPLPWGATGCCPPGGMDALMKCYCDIQAASAFIGQILIDQINNNPAVTEAIIAAIEKSGSSLPLIGVTDGSNAQPGQVGEFVAMLVNGTIPVAGQTNAPVSFGVLPAGDWDCWAWLNPSVFLGGVIFGLTAVPAGAVISNQMLGQSTIPGGTGAFIVNSSTARISISVPTLIVFALTTEPVTTAGTYEFQFEARRAR